MCGGGFYQRRIGARSSRENRRIRRFTDGGLGLPARDAFPARLGKALAAKGINADIVNAGVSGDTTTGGLARVDWSVPDGTEAVILELGANDALRGVDPAVTRQALEGILTKLKARKITVLLCGMYAPPNMGGAYVDAFGRLYSELATTHNVVFYPFFLDGVAADEKYQSARRHSPLSRGCRRHRRPHPAES